MIDFRYHLVSLVAVFIALAIGIALGAGPLREGISSTLENEVRDLRTERADLRSQVDAAANRAAAKDEALGLVADRVSADTLAGVRVGVVLTPGSARSAVARVDEALELAGADLVLTVELDASFEDPEQVQENADLVAEHAGTLQLPDSRRADGATLATLLAATLAGADRPGATGGWLAVAEALEDDGVLSLTWHDNAEDEVLDRRPADVYVVLSGGLASEDLAEEPGVERLAGRLDLIEALTRSDLPLVVSAPGGEGNPVAGTVPVDPLVTAVRADRDLSDEVSSVDNLESASGLLATTLAVGWEAVGESGHYGVAGDAQASMPVPPPVVPVPAPGPGGPTLPSPQPTQTAEPTQPVPDDSATTAEPDDSATTSEP